MNKLQQAMALYAEAQKIKDEASELTADVMATITEKMDQADALKAEHEAEMKILSRLNSKPSAPSATVQTPATVASVQVGQSSIEKDPWAGFKGKRDFFKAFIGAGYSKNAMASNDERIRFLAAVGSDEQRTDVGEYGGLAAPEGMMAEYLKVQAEMDPTAGLVREIGMDTPTLKMNARVDKDNSTSVTGGFTVSRVGETGEITASRQKTERITLDVNKLAGLCYITSEMLQDSPSAVVSMLEDWPAEFASHEYEEKINGTGVGSFLGVLNSPALVSVAKESSQVADTIVVANLTKMISRLYDPMGRAVWIANRETIPQLAQLGSDTSSKLIWMNDSVNGFPATLFGIPIVFNTYNERLGDKGDIMLCNWSEYLVGQYGGLKQAESDHVRFIYDEKGIRITKRNDARPWWTSALQPKKSAPTLSPFVTLDARA